MNANAVVGMNNTFSALMNYTAAEVLEKHIDQLLYPTDEISLRIPLSGIDFCGFQEVKQAILTLYADEKGTAHLLHSAAYKTDGLPAGEAEANWNTYSYKVASRGTAGGAQTIKYQFVRFTIGFKQAEDKTWKIKSIYALPLMTLAPWGCANPDLPGAMQSGGPNLIFKQDPFRSIDPDDFVKIRNLAGFFTHYAPAHATEYFSTEEDVCVDLLNKTACGYAAVKKLFDDWKQADAQMGYLNRKLTVTNTVITYGETENKAVLSGIGHVFDSEVLDKEKPAFATVRRVVAVYMTFARECGAWKIVTVRLVPVVSIDREINMSPRMLEPMPSRVPDYFPTIDPNHPGMDAGDVFEVESILPEWTERLKRGDLETFPDKYMVNEHEEIAFSMRKAFVGYEAVMERCHDLIHGQIKGKTDLLRFPQFHSGCTPVITSDGKYAQGIWTDICWGNIGALIFYEDHQKSREYLPGVGQYTHSFVKSKNGWRIYHLADRSEYVAPMIDWPYNIDEVGGWTVAQKPSQWPLPFDCG